MRDRRPWLASIVALALSLAFDCANVNRVADGSSSETVIGTVFNIDGTPAHKSKVILIPADYDPALPLHRKAIIADSTDETGAYRIAVNGGGSYNILAVGLGRADRAMVWGVDCAADRNSVLVPSCTLLAPGAIKVVLGGGLDTVNGYVFIPGTMCFSFLVGAKGAVVLDSVAAGPVPAVYYGKNSQASPQKIVDSLTVLPADTTISSYAAWKHSARLHLNTTASGAGVAGAVTDFPVLVRLTAPKFDFSQAAKDGGDIRFVKPDGALYSFEIERWDSAGGAAEIWVRVDTVWGNDDTHYIKMLWAASTGSATASLSSGASVFDTADGFQGVWHLAETNGPALDATQNHFDGTPSDTAPLAASGQIGAGKRFNGGSNFFDMKNTASGKLNFAENATYMVSAWAYADTLDNRFHCVVGKSDNQYFLKLKQYYPPNPMRWEFAEYHDKAGWQITDTLASARVWTYIAGIRQGTRQVFYVNGEAVDSVIEVKADTSARYTGDDLTIGRFLTYSIIDGSYCPFKGLIDEVRISNVALSADWIKLCYMNQKETDALVVFK